MASRSRELQDLEEFDRADAHGPSLADAPDVTDREALEIAGLPVPRLAAEVRKVAAEQRLAVVNGKDSAIRLAILLVALVGTAVLASLLDTWAVWVVYWLVAGAVFTSCFAAVHEALHGSLFDHPVFNHAAGLLTGTLSMMPYSTYRAYHLEHHLKTHEEGDTEPILVVRSIPAYVATVVFAIAGLAVILWTQFVAVLFGRGAGWAHKRRRPGMDLASGAAMVLAIAALVMAGFTFGWRWPLLLWLAPLAVYFPLAGLISTTEHYECAYGPGSVFVTTRTVLSSAALRFLVWNANYHTAHHLLAAVPGYNLERLHALIEQDCQVVEQSYVRYHLGALGRVRRKQFPDEPDW